MSNNKILNRIKKSYIYILLSIIYIPLIFLIFLSFTNGSDKGNINGNFDWNFGDNYLNLFKDSSFINALLNTLIITGFVTPISVIIATITCYGIWNSSKFFKKGVLNSAKVNIINPEVITGISLTLLFSSTWIALGFNFGIFTVILAHISFCTPYAIITIYPRMNKMNKNLANASKDLGYNSFKTFFNIVIPFLLPSILGALGIVFAMSFDDFIITNLVRGKVTTISSEMYLMAKGIKTWAVTFGAIVIFISFIFIFTKSTFLKKKQSKNLLSNKKYEGAIKW